MNKRPFTAQILLTFALFFGASSVAFALDCSPFTPEELKQMGYNERDMRIICDFDTSGMNLETRPYLYDKNCDSVRGRRDAVYIGILPLDASCPEGWITRGESNNDEGVKVQWCAFCGEGYKNQLNRFSCCEKID